LIYDLRLYVLVPLCYTLVGYCIESIGRPIERVQGFGRSVDQSIAHVLRFRFLLGCRVVLGFTVLHACTPLRYYIGVLKRIGRPIGRSVDRARFSIGRPHVFKFKVSLRM
jgi:hypothetical protein